MKLALVMLLCCAALASAQEPPLGGGYSCSPALANSAEGQQAIALAAREFMASAPGGPAVPTCTDYTTTPTEVCSQVVAGTNYNVSFQIQCPGQAAYTVQAIVFFPLPGSNQMPQVSELATAGLPAAPVPADAGVVSSPTADVGAPIVGGYTCDPTLVNSTEVQQLAELAGEQFMATLANGTVDMPVCDDYELDVLDVCTQVVAGTNYKLTFQVTCPSLNDAEPYNVEAVVFLPLPTSNEPPQVTSLATSGSPVFADPTDAAIAGGFSCDPALVNNPEVLQSLQLAGQTYVDGANAGAFAQCDGFFAQLVKACSQVVAGINYDIDFTLTCPEDPSITPVNLSARVFVPLPFSNEPPQLISLVPTVGSQ